MDEIKNQERQKLFKELSEHDKDLIFSVYNEFMTSDLEYHVMQIIDGWDNDEFREFLDELKKEKLHN